MCSSVIRLGCTGHSDCSGHEWSHDHEWRHEWLHLATFMRWWKSWWNINPLLPSLLTNPCRGMKATPIPLMQNKCLSIFEMPTFLVMISSHRRTSSQDHFMGSMQRNKQVMTSQHSETNSFCSYQLLGCGLPRDRLYQVSRSQNHWTHWMIWSCQRVHHWIVLGIFLQWYFRLSFCTTRLPWHGRKGLEFGASVADWLLPHWTCCYFQWRGSWSYLGSHCCRRHFDSCYEHRSDSHYEGQQEATETRAVKCSNRKRVKYLQWLDLVHTMASVTTSLHVPKPPYFQFSLGHEEPSWGCVAVTVSWTSALVVVLFPVGFLWRWFLCNSAAYHYIMWLGMASWRTGMDKPSSPSPPPCRGKHRLM